MELVRGRRPERFRVHGMFGYSRNPYVPKSNSPITRIAALNTLGVIALYLGLVDLGDRLARRNRI